MNLNQIIKIAETETSIKKLKEIVELFSDEVDITKFYDQTPEYESEIVGKDLTAQIDNHLSLGFDPKDQTAAGCALSSMQRFDQKVYQNPRQELIDGLRLCAQIEDSALYLSKVTTMFPYFVRAHPSRYSAVAADDIINRTPQVIIELMNEKQRIARYLKKLIKNVVSVKKLPAGYK